MRRPIACGLLALSLLATSCELSPRNPRAGRSIDLSDCQLEAPGHPTRIAAKCGTLSVYEDRAGRRGRKIDLRLAVVPAVSRDPEPDPLVFLAGGPGQAATESFATLHGAFRRILRERDVVLVDQRGTGGSNALRCPRPEETASLWLLDDADIEQWVTRCLSKLGADPRFYTTTNAVEDLEDVRQALGYQSVNLYGVSYGTRAALSYLRRFPDRVRSIILDGIVPPAEVLGVDVARDAERALDLMIERCGRDPACREAFPKLEEALDQLVVTLSEPAAVTLRDPRSAEERTIWLDRGMVSFAIRLLTYSQETVALVPLLLRSAARGDLAPLAAQFLMTTSQLNETVSDGMGISVICSEDFPFLDENAVEERDRDTYLGALQTDTLRRVCPLWPRGEIPADFKEPVDSDVPALLLSGEADPVTPPENAERVASGLANSLHLVAPGQGHVVIHRGCLPSIAARFIQTGSIEELSTECVGDIEPPAFFTRFTGPEP